MKCGKFNFRIEAFVFFLLFSLQGLIAQDGELRVSIYDDFDDGAFGRSEHRSVYRSVKLSAFSRTRTLPVASPARDESSFLTALVLSADSAERMVSGQYPWVTSREDGSFLFRKEGLEFVFSLEKPGPGVMRIIEEYYVGDHESWRDAVTRRYEDNFIIRVHSAENIFDPWKDIITMNEAVLMAAVIADGDQWLWGIHDGLDLLNHRP